MLREAVVSTKDDMEFGPHGSPAQITGVPRTRDDLFFQFGPTQSHPDTTVEIEVPGVKEIFNRDRESHINILDLVIHPDTVIQIIRRLCRGR
jgi:hypothetical protein